MGAMTNRATTQASKGKGRFTARPSGAYKLLGLLLYTKTAFVDISWDGRQYMHSIAKMARVLGTESSKVRKWLEYLESQGYLQGLTISQNRRAAVYKIRKPPNI